jgi:ankyrin repeat protein
MLAPALLLAMAVSTSEAGNKPELTPLMKAAAKNNLHRVRNLLLQGVDVNQRSTAGETALYEAIERRDPTRDNSPLVDALLAAGADPNEPAIYGLSPLVLSLTRDYSNPAVTMRLLKAGAHVSRDCDEVDSTVSLATQDSSVEVIVALLDKGAPVNCQDVHGETALHWAAMNGEADLVAALLKGGADSNLRNKEGKTPLEVAVTTSPESGAGRVCKDARTVGIYR